MPIEDAKFVKEIKSNAPKKGDKVIWSDGKYDNIWDKKMLPILQEALKTDRLVAYTKEQNDAGYWNITELHLATVDETEDSPATNKPAESKDTIKKPTQGEDRQQQIMLQHATACAFQAANAGWFPWEKVYSLAENTLKFYNGEITADEANQWCIDQLNLLTK